MYHVVLYLMSFLNPIPRCTRMYIVWYINTRFRTSRYILSSVCISKYIGVYTFGGKYIPVYTWIYYLGPTCTIASYKYPKNRTTRYIKVYTSIYHIWSRWWKFQMVAQARVQARRRGEPGMGLPVTQPGSDRDGTVTAP